MKINWSAKTHEAWVNDIAANGYDTIGILKFDNGRYIKNRQALALFKAYWHKVDRTVFGRAADKGYGVKRWCFSELGTDNRNLHLHFVAVSPFPALPFCAVLNALWTNFNVRTAHYEFNWITPIRHRHKAAAYTTKGTKHFAYDEIGSAVSYQPIDALLHDQFDAEAQTRRIKNRLTHQHLNEAYEQLQAQIKETDLRLEQRQQRL